MNYKGKTVVLSLCLLPLLSCAASPKQEVSDHFDGTKYFNPTLKDQFSPSFGDIMKMMSEGRVEWPDKVEPTTVPNVPKAVEPDQVAVTFVNHATFLIQLPGLNILTDPVWSERASPVSWAGPKRVREAGLAIDDLPKIDVIVISHNHYDHLDLATLKILNERFSPKVIVPVGDKALVQSAGFQNITELDWWESIKVDPETKVTFTPAQHSSARGLFDRDKSLWGSYFIQNKHRSVYFGGDAGYSTHYVDINKRLGPPDVALLGIGSYAPRWFMRTIHMDPAEAVKAHKDLDAKLSIGMHFGTFQLSAEGIEEPLNDLRSALENNGLSKESFITLPEGKTQVFQ